MSKSNVNKTFKELQKNSKGITLVALVITIVILIILASVSINVVLGEGGLIQQSKIAKEMTLNSTIAEEESMNTLMAEYANIMASEPDIPEPEPTPKSEVQTAKEEGTVFGEKTPITDEKNNTIMVPAGFKIAQDSGDTVQQGIVIEDVSASTDANVQGSQYVWIPVGTFKKDNGETSGNIQLARYIFSTSSPGTPTAKQYATNYTATPINIYGVNYTESATYDAGKESAGSDAKNATAKDLKGFIDSVDENGGYYIGRYEASYASGSSTANYKAASKVSTGNSTSSMSYTKGTLWNFITQPAASKVAINTYAESSSVKSDLINSYAWDTAIVYIQEAGHTNYANQTRKHTSLSNTGNLAEGIKDEVCKINDMASNIWEWTTEHSDNTYSSNANPCVYRGGFYGGSNGYTAYRSYNNSTYSNHFVGFRLSLYM